MRRRSNNSRSPKGRQVSARGLWGATPLLTLLGTLLLSLAVPAAGAEPARPAWLLDLMARLTQIPERHSTFREEKHFAALDRPLISLGQLVYRRPTHLEKITTAPEAESLVVDGDRLTLTASNDAPHSFPLDRRPEIAALVDAVRGSLAGDLAVLERQYRVSAEGDLAVWRLTLQPLDQSLRRLLRQITIDGTGTEIRTFRTTQANGDEAIMSIASPP
jgi:hypothetical protein